MGERILANAMPNAGRTELRTMTDGIEGQKADMQAKDKYQTPIFIKILLMSCHEQCIIKSEAKWSNANAVAKAMPECIAANDMRKLVIIMATPKRTCSRISTEPGSSAPLVANSPEVG